MRSYAEFVPWVFWVEQAEWWHCVTASQMCFLCISHMEFFFSRTWRTWRKIKEIKTWGINPVVFCLLKAFAVSLILYLVDNDSCSNKNLQNIWWLEINWISHSFKSRNTMKFSIPSSDSRTKGTSICGSIYFSAVFGNLNFYLGIKVMQSTSFVWLLKWSTSHWFSCHCFWCTWLFRTPESPVEQTPWLSLEVVGQKYQLLDGKKF